MFKLMVYTPVHLMYEGYSTVHWRGGGEKRNFFIYFLLRCLAHMFSPGRRRAGSISKNRAILEKSLAVKAPPLSPLDGFGWVIA